jgi:hypothetical protein
MKILSLWRNLLVPLASTIAISAFAGSASSGKASNHAGTGPNVRISFVNPQFFTDIRINNLNEFKSAKIFGDEMTQALSPVVAKAAPGCTLVLQFTDIDLRGRYKYGRPQRSQIRFDNGAYPIRMTFNYTLTDSKGRVLSHGTESLVNAPWLGWYGPGEIRYSWDYLYYEKETLLKWAAQNIRA